MIPFATYWDGLSEVAKQALSGQSDVAIIEAHDAGRDSAKHFIDCLKGEDDWKDAVNNLLECSEEDGLGKDEAGIINDLTDEIWDQINERFEEMTDGRRTPTGWLVADTNGDVWAVFDSRDAAENCAENLRITHDENVHVVKGDYDKELGWLAAEAIEEEEE